MNPSPPPLTTRPSPSSNCTELKVRRPTEGIPPTEERIDCKLAIFAALFSSASKSAGVVALDPIRSLSIRDAFLSLSLSLSFFSCFFFSFSTSNARFLKVLNTDVDVGWDEEAETEEVRGLKGSSRSTEPVPSRRAMATLESSSCIADTWYSLCSKKV